ncbi:ZNF570 isoform 1 [Pan troglodytes]|uniref:Zinc finger protein 570 n=2 Tax=Homininae TaxID=207598 RepID=K7EQY8_HUMAN|nr:ZNF570 isoform 1 [Pan troglodytes]
MCMYLFFLDFSIVSVTVLLDFMTRDRERKVVWPDRLTSKQTWPY